MRYRSKNTFNIDLRRPPLPENCICPNCDKKLKQIELLNKKCLECDYVFFTNLHGEPIVFYIPNGNDIKKVSGYMPRKHTEAIPLKEKVFYKSGALCPHCEKELTIVEMNARYCRRCQNSYHITPAGDPIIVEIDETKDAKSRIFINFLR